MVNMHDDFRRIALGMKDAAESAHMDHPDFRVGNRIFATLHADNEWGMVILTPEQQQRFMEEAPKAFVPEKGAWGLRDAPPYASTLWKRTCSARR